MIPTPKLDVGDSAFVASAGIEPHRVKCPDCLGSGEWSVTAPNGDTWKVGCNTCRHGYEHPGTVNSWEVTPKVQSMTVGSVRVDTHADDPVQYMMRETGVGSGTIHYEKNVFTSHAKALVRAKELATKGYGDRYLSEVKSRERARDDHLYPPDWKTALERENARLMRANALLRRKNKALRGDQ